MEGQTRGHSHGGQGDKCGEGSGCDGGDPIVVEGKQPHGAQASEGVIVHTADHVTPQHPAGSRAGVREQRCPLSSPDGARVTEATLMPAPQLSPPPVTQLCPVISKA